MITINDTLGTDLYWHTGQILELGALGRTSVISSDGHPRMGGDAVHHRNAVYLAHSRGIVDLRQSAPAIAYSVLVSDFE
jgi:hypothetical protein